MHGKSLEFDNLSKNDRNPWTHNRVTGSSEDRFHSDFNGFEGELNGSGASSLVLETLIRQYFELNVQYSPNDFSLPSINHFTAISLVSSFSPSDNLVKNLSKILANYALIISHEVSIKEEEEQKKAAEERIIGLLRDTKEAIFNIQTTHNLLFHNEARGEARTMASQKKHKHAQRTNRLAAKVLSSGSSSNKERSISKKTRHNNPLKLIPPCESLCVRNKKKQVTRNSRRKRSIKKHTPGVGQKREKSQEEEQATEEEHEEEEKCQFAEEEKQTASETNSSESLKMKEVQTASPSPAFAEVEEKNVGSPNMGEILDEMKNSGGASSEQEKTRYRLVKRKPERKQNNLNNSVYHNEPAAGYYNYQICSRSSPKPGCLADPIPAFLIPPIMDEKSSQSPQSPQGLTSNSDGERERVVECAKENDESKEEDEEENETREGSQKEQESLYERLEQFDEIGEFMANKAILIENQNLNKTQGIISEKWSNSDSKELETEDYFEERLSQLSHSVASEASGTPNKKKIEQDNEGYIQVTTKKKPNNRRRKGENDPYNNNKNRREYEYEAKRQEKPKKSENNSRYNGKPGTQTIIYEAKNTHTAKVIIPANTPANITKTPVKNTKAPDATNYPTLAETYQAKPPLGSSTPQKRKALSLKSACLDVNVIKNTKMKDLAKQYFDKKLEKDIFEHVAGLTEKSNNMMPYRMMAHSRIDYCLKRIFSGFNVQTKIFGSCATGLALPTSDIDICICGAPTYVRSDITTYLTTIYDKLKKFKWVVSIKNVLSANVPIMKLEIDPTIEFSEINEKLDEFSMMKTIIEEAPEELNELKEMSTKRIKIDLSIESFMPMVGGNTSHLGYKSTDFVQKMLDEHSSLYTIAILLKEFLNNRGFLDNYQGGLSSYVLVVMIVAIFRKFKDEGETKSFKRLMNFYGKEFLPEKTGISIVGTEPFFPLNYCYEDAPLYILDNMNFMGRNIGQGAFAIKKILGEFEKAANMMKTAEEKIGEIAIKHREEINCLEDLEKIQDENLLEIDNENLIDVIIGKNLKENL